jgi:hypothetical protein
MGGYTREVENEKKAILRTGRPLTIACHMKKGYFFFVESTLALAVSTMALPAESNLALAVSTIALAVSVTALAVESALDSLLAELLQAAAKAPIANTNKSFFMVIMILV